jgi:hypothetical protein
LRSKKTPEFDELFDRLPEDIQQRARDAYRTWMTNPRHPALHFERMRGRRDLCSVRITRGYRALGLYEAPDMVVWFWISSHAEYDRLIGRS